MNNELFIELSDEQQELVAGGLDLGASLTTFQAKQVEFATVSTSGPGGSTAAGAAATLEINTSGLSIVALDA